MGLISYIKTVWQAGKSGNTPFTPERFNNIEDGIEQATNELNDKETRLTAAEDGITEILTDLQDKEARTQLLESIMTDVALNLSDHDEAITELQGDVAEINSNLSLKQGAPTWLTADNLDAQYFSDATFHWGYGIINNIGYISFSAGWMTIQFQIQPSQKLARFKYGSGNWSGWSAF